MRHDRRLDARLWPEESIILANYFLRTASSGRGAPQHRAPRAPTRDDDLRHTPGGIR
ncbi:hypothetical protein BSIN_1689 [Burkholderia singularis]|uniref:Uncharacterized protein n=1 Tax=Burkholderia singularis TaxID=1503053 RepID=A0A238GZJ1_9BURK|nr:hypothetical protein BSIN_1689 [Burkholderia singularis]